MASSETAQTASATKAKPANYKKAWKHYIQTMISLTRSEWQRRDRLGKQTEGMFK